MSENNKYIKAFKLFNSLGAVTYKKEFDDSVEEYKRLMSYYKSKVSKMDSYSYFLSSAINEDRLGVVQPSTMIEEHALAYMNLIWDFNSTPFSIKHFRETENTDDVKDFYTDVRTLLNLHLRDTKTNFKISFYQFVRSWVEYGVGVLEVSYYKESFRCVAHSPEIVQYEYDSKGRLINVLIKTSEIRVVNGDIRQEVDVITHYEHILVGDKFKWFKSVHASHGSLDIEVDMQLVKYTPIFISCHNQQIGTNVGLGIGLEALCIIRILNNISASMEEAVSKKLSPSAIINGLSFSSDINSNKLGAALFTSKQALSSTEPSFTQLRWEFDLSDAMGIYQQYQNDLRQLLSRNKMVDEKGRARMTGQEFAARDNYDTVHYTSNSSSLIDIFLKPLLRNLTAFVSTFRGIDTIPDLIKDEITGVGTFNEVDITIENYINKLEGESRKKAIVDGMQMIGMITDIQAKMQQSGGGQMDFSGVIKEVKRLSNLELTPESEAQESAVSLSSQMEYMKANRA